MPRRTAGKNIFESESEYSAVRLQYRDHRAESEFPGKFRAYSECDELLTTLFINPVYVSFQIFIAGHPQKLTNSKPPSSNNHCKSAKFRRFHILAAKSILEIEVSNFLSTVFLEFLKQSFANCLCVSAFPQFSNRKLTFCKFFILLPFYFFLILNIFLNIHLR